MLTRLLRHSVLPTACFLGTMTVLAAQANANQTHAQCTPVPYSNGDYETVIERGPHSATLIRWTPAGSDYFGDAYTPERRCQAVTGRLNQALARSQGSLGDLVLTNGYVNNETVICALNPMETGCNKGNVLFTLKPENASRAGDILGQLLQISRQGAVAGYITETDQGQTYVNLGDWADQALVDSGDTTPDSPAPSPTFAPEPPPQRNPVAPPADSGGSMF
ncbi:MAG: COP23 domain-containing protein [Phormidium sp.]